MQIKGNQEFLKKYRRNGFLLAHFRNLPEMHSIWSDYCFNFGSRGRGNGINNKKKASPLCGSNIWLADSSEVVIIHQTDNGKGPLCVSVYSRLSKEKSFLGSRVWDVIRQYDLPYVVPEIDF